MLTIRKQNFESQPCYCCDGVKANYSDPRYAVVYTLYHKLPDDSIHMQAQVVVPRCKHCAEKLKPIKLLSAIGAIIGAAAGFFYTYSTNGVGVSCFVAVLWAIGSFIALGYILNMAFANVYQQTGSNYDIVNVMTDQYGWQWGQPQKGDSDVSFTDARMNEMLNDLATNYHCEFADL